MDELAPERDMPPPQITFVIDCDDGATIEDLASTLDSIAALHGLAAGQAEVIVVGSVPLIPHAVRDRIPAPIREAGFFEIPRGARLDRAARGARGAYLALARSGERWAPAFWETLRQELRSDRRRAFAWGQAAIPQSSEHQDQWWGPQFGEPRLEVLRAARGCAVLLRQAAVEAEGGIDPELDQIPVIDLLVRLTLSARYRRVAATLATAAPVGDPAAAAAEWAVVRDRHARALARQRRGSVRALLAAKEIRPFDPETWAPPRRELLWQSLLEHNSLGVVGRALMEAVERLGVIPHFASMVETPPPDLAHHARPADGRGRLAFHFDNRLLPGSIPAERVVFYGMVETSRITDLLIDLINRHVAICFVPCELSRLVFRGRGVRVPVIVLPHGVDAAVFPLMERPVRPVFTFGSVGQFGNRKGLDVLIRAFQAEFRPDEAVRLVLKGPTTGVIDEPITDPRIEVRTETVSLAQLQEIYRSFDAFVLPSRGEGFGLCGLEAMATGLPTIATNWSGPADYLDPRDSLPLDYRLRSARLVTPMTDRRFGDWAEPDEEHLRTLMRWVVTNRDEAAAMGRAASRRVHRDWTWDAPARQLVDHLDGLALGISPAR